jgi:hypothetical protein
MHLSFVSAMGKIDSEYIRHLSSDDGSIVHSGDERHRALVEDDETIHLIPTVVDPRVNGKGL